MLTISESGKGDMNVVCATLFFHPSESLKLLPNKKLEKKKLQEKTVLHLEGAILTHPICDPKSSPSSPPLNSPEFPEHPPPSLAIKTPVVCSHSVFTHLVSPGINFLWAQLRFSIQSWAPSVVDPSSSSKAHGSLHLIQGASLTPRWVRCLLESTLW